MSGKASSFRRKDGFLTALAADAGGRVLEIPGYAAVGASGGELRVLRRAETAPLPHGSELMMLPGRAPVVYDLARKRLATLAESPFSPGEPLFAVAAFNAPAYLVTATAAYE